MATSPQGCKRSRVKGVVYEEEETSVGSTSCEGGASEGGPVWKTEVQGPQESSVMETGEWEVFHVPSGLSLSRCAGPSDGSECPPPPPPHPPCGICQCTAKTMMWCVSDIQKILGLKFSVSTLFQWYSQSVFWDSYSHPDSPDHS